MHRPATHAEASRQRKDVVSGQVMEESRLVRFVQGPDGAVVPDLARKLPGRGIWVEATRAAVDHACAKNLFSRSAKTRLAVPAGLSDKVEVLLLQRLLAGLGLARKAGDLVQGFEKVADALSTGRCAVLIEAVDGAEEGRRKMLALARRSASPPLLAGLFTNDELGLALGLDNVIHTAFLAGRGSARWVEDAQRLSGFRPLTPLSWREEP